MKLAKNMTDDAEIICAWMEPVPELPMFWDGHEYSYSDGGVWLLVRGPGGSMKWEAKRLNLDDLHDAESQLAGLQRISYSNRLEAQMGAGQWIWHATTEQKIRALASAIRAWKEGKQ